MKLFVTNNIPYPDKDGGRKLTLGRILEASKSKKVVLISYNYDYSNLEEATSFFKERNIKFIPFTSQIKLKHSRLFIYLKTFFSKNSYFNFHLSEKEFVSFIEKTIKENHFDEISFETIFFLNTMPEELMDTTHTEFVLHNVESVFFRELSKDFDSLSLKIAFFIESIKTKFLENKLSNMLHRNNIFAVTLTDEDKKIYIKKFAFLENKIIMNHNHIYIDKKLYHQRLDSDEYFLFPGSLTFPPNKQGILWLLNEYEKCSLNIPIYITGAITDEIKNDFLFSKKVKFIGFVSKEELNSLYEHTVSVISPIISGGGIKIKNIETIQKGIPIIMTKFSAIGIENLDGKKIIVNDSNREFCEKMVEVFYDK